MVGVHRHHIVFPSAISARAIAFVTLFGAATGRRVCQRSVFTWGILASAWVASAMRRGESVNGSPPVRMTSQTSVMRAHIVERRVELGRAEDARAGTDPLAAKAEAAIDRADRDELDQHPVGIAMHQSPTGLMASSPIGSSLSAGSRMSSRASGTNWRAIGSAGSPGRDERGERRRQADRVALGHGLKLGKPFGRRKARVDQLFRSCEALVGASVHCPNASFTVDRLRGPAIPPPPAFSKR